MSESRFCRGQEKDVSDAKQLKRDKKDIVGGYFVKSSAGEIVTEENDIREVWREYYSDLLNVENPNEIPEERCVEGPVKDICEEEVMKALRSMKVNKASGPSGITCDLFKSAGRTGIEQITKVFQQILDTEICPEEWKDSTTLPFYKGKGDPLQCGKYRGIRLLEHGMKLWEKVLDGRLKEMVRISDNQFGFSSGRTTTDPIFMLRLIQQKYTEKEEKALPYSY